MLKYPPGAGGLLRVFVVWGDGEPTPRARHGDTHWRPGETWIATLGGAGHHQEDWETHERRQVKTDSLMPDITRHIGRQMKGDKWISRDKMNWRGSAGHLLRKNWESQPSTVWGKSALQNKSALLWRCLTKVAQKSVLHVAKKKSEECECAQPGSRESVHERPTRVWAPKECLRRLPKKSYFEEIWRLWFKPDSIVFQTGRGSLNKSACISRVFSKVSCKIAQFFFRHACVFTCTWMCVIHVAICECCGLAKHPPEAHIEMLLRHSPKNCSVEPSL